MSEAIAPRPSSSSDWDRIEQQPSSAVDREWARLEQALNGLSLPESLGGTTTRPPHVPPVAAADASDGTAGAGALERWGRFEVREMVGRGAFGRVYRVWDPELRTEFALKVLHRRVSDERLRRALLDEGRALPSTRRGRLRGGPDVSWRAWWS